VEERRAPPREVSEVLVVASDLMARERLRAAADRLGMGVTFARPGEARSFEGYDVVVLDLDEIGIESVPEAAEGGPRLLGYFSHVDVALKEKAEAQGVRPVRRGRFWSDLDSYLKP
jgi:hypothetical protein